jgi:hypothetical protein
MMAVKASIDFVLITLPGWARIALPPASWIQLQTSLTEGKWVSCPDDYSLDHFSRIKIDNEKNIGFDLIIIIIYLKFNLHCMLSNID